MKVQKRNGTEQDFQESKIRNAIMKANNSKKVEDKDRLSEEQIDKVFTYVMKILSKWEASITSDNIQEVVKQGLMKYNHYAVAETYILYVHDKEKNEKFNHEEKEFMALVQNKNEQARGDNANKKTTVNASMRDYGTGFICKDIFAKLAPKEISSAHKDGFIHFHDADYFYQPLTNCGLINAFDMFENGFVMTGKHIDPPGTFRTGSNLAAQINLQFSGLQYGGQTFSWAALLPALRRSKLHFAHDIVQDIYTMHGIDIDFKEIKGSTPDEVYDAYLKDYVTKQIFDNLLRKKTKEEVRFGIKTYQWQILCHMSSNGQTPFVTNVLNLREAQNQEELDDLALIIEEMLKRRIKGVKDEYGHMSTPLFPKLLYWGCEGLNMKPGDPYYYLTELAGDCMIKRMAPDLNSERKCREVKHGQIIPSMGCLSGDTQIRMLINGQDLTDTFENFWDILSGISTPKGQFGIKDNPNLEINLKDIKIWDNVKNGWVDCYKIIRNESTEKETVIFTANNSIEDEKEEKVLQMTLDHKMTLINGQDIEAKELVLGDKVYGDKNGSKVFEVSSIKITEEKWYSYDVTTESAHFMANDIYSHNCRSWLSDLWEDNTYPIDKSFYWQEITEQNEKFEGAYDKNFDYSRGFGEYSPIPLDKHVVLNFRGNSGWVVGHDDKTITIREPKVYGRWNMGVVSLNIPKVALDAKEKGIDFWENLDNYMELVRRSLLFRWNTLKSLCHAYNSPILWMYGGYDRAPADATLEDIHNAHPGRSSISVGFVGLSETCWIVKGVSNTSEEGEEFAKQILTFMNKKCDEWKPVDHVNYSIYGTPEESLTKKFAECLSTYGLMEHVTDKGYVVNSYHIDPREKIDAFKKLKIESEYLSLCKGGAISYIEVAPMFKNKAALLALIEYIWETIAYGEINTKIDICYKCGFEGEIPLIKTGAAKFQFKCPHCGNEDESLMSCTRRTCGYLGEANNGNMNLGRLDEIINRWVHVS